MIEVTRNRDLLLVLFPEFVFLTVSVLTLESSKSGWNSRESLKGTQPQSIAFDPLDSGRAYCATFGNGLWRTEDNGQTWSNIGKDVISSPYVMSVAVSSLNSGKELNKVYTGTEPSAFYTSNDGGDSWERMESLNTYTFENN
jgi:hypothetical protein